MNIGRCGEEEEITFAPPFLRRRPLFDVIGAALFARWFPHESAFLLRDERGEIDAKWELLVETLHFLCEEYKVMVESCERMRNEQSRSRRR